MNRRSALPILAAGLVAMLAACGGGGGDSVSTADDAPTLLDAGGSGDVAIPDVAAAQPVSLLPSQVDLIGEAVQPASEIATNELPPVVLDDVSTGRKVNFRNLVPQDLPVLLWMWAPS